MSESLETTYALLEKASELITEINTKTDKLRADLPHVQGNLREVEYIFYRVSSILGRMGLPKEIDRAIMQMQRMILVARLLGSAIHYLEIAAAATTPWGWAYQIILAGLSVASSGIIMGNLEVTNR